MDDESDGLEENGVLGVGVLNLLGLGRLLGLVENRLQALHQPALDGAILWRRVALQQAQQLAGEPRRRHKVVGVVLQVSGGRRHDLERRGETGGEISQVTCMSTPNYNLDISRVDGKRDQLS